MMIKINLNYLVLNQNDTYPFKHLLALSLYCSKLFDLSFSAALDDENDIMYQVEKTEDTELLLD